jgi:hypothetical protein
LPGAVGAPALNQGHALGLPLPGAGKIQSVAGISMATPVQDTGDIARKSNDQVRRGARSIMCWFINGNGA